MPIVTKPNIMLFGFELPDIKNVFYISAWNAPIYVFNQSPNQMFDPGSLSPYSAIRYSLLKLFTGLANAALTAWKLSVINATISIKKAAAPKIHQLMEVRYAKF